MIIYIYIHVHVYVAYHGIEMVWTYQVEHSTATGMSNNSS